MEVMMTITQWPADERPREKLMHSGGGVLTDAELLAIFLRTGVKGKTAVEVARDLLRQYGGLRQVLRAASANLPKKRGEKPAIGVRDAPSVGHTQALQDAPGVGPAKCALLQAALELGKRNLLQKLEKEGPLTSPTQASDYLIHQLRDRPREIFAIVYLDNRHYVLDYEELFEGTLSGAMVHPREVVKRALERNAAAVILAHNHPSGIAEPSTADAQITQRLKDALNMVEVRLLDHLVIGDGEFVSMSDRGLF